MTGIIRPYLQNHTTLSVKSYDPVGGTMRTVKHDNEPSGLLCMFNCIKLYSVIH